MALSRVDSEELLTALHSNVGVDPLATFLDRLRRRARARSAMLIERRGGRGSWTVRRRSADPGGAPPPPDRSALGAMRPERVYAIDELGLSKPRSGRVIRWAIEGGDLWLGVLDAATGFTAADSALLSSLAPHAAIASDNRARAEALSIRLAAAEAALARAGVAWSLLDGSGDPIARAGPAASAKTRTTLIDMLAKGGNVAVADGTLAIHLPRRLGDASDTTLALARTGVTPIDRVRAFALEFRVPRSEARLAVAMAEGATLDEAATALGITITTARFYSKRLYAATGAKGQADLVRLIWTGITALG